MSIGIDFGFSHVKIVEIEPKDSGFTIKNIGSKPIPANAWPIIDTAWLSAST